MIDLFTFSESRLAKLRAILLDIYQAWPDTCMVWRSIRTLPSKHEWWSRSRSGKTRIGSSGPIFRSLSAPCMEEKPLTGSMAAGIDGEEKEVVDW